MEKDITPIRKAGLIPTACHIAMFDDILRQFGVTSTDNDGLQKQPSLHETLRKFSEMATVQGKAPMMVSKLHVCGKLPIPLQVTSFFAGNEILKLSADGSKVC